MLMFNGAEPSRRFSWRAIAWLAIYVLFLCATPFEHHDLSCELKTPQHCIACTSTIVSSYPDVGIAVGLCALVETGRAIAPDVRRESLLLGVRTPGRSPPARA